MTQLVNAQVQYGLKELPRKIILLSQGLVESGLSDLVPIGMVRHDVYGYETEGHTTEKLGMERVVEVLTEVYPDVRYLLNVKLNVYASGHPSRGYRNCIITGDAYRQL